MIQKKVNIIGRYTRKKCVFCKEGLEPSCPDTSRLHSFITERGKIIPRLKTGTCVTHQKKLVKQIKQARFLSLLPITQKL